MADVIEFGFFLFNIYNVCLFATEINIQLRQKRQEAAAPVGDLAFEILPANGKVFQWGIYFLFLFVFDNVRPILNDVVLGSFSYRSFVVLIEMFAFVYLVYVKLPAWVSVFPELYDKGHQALERLNAYIRSKNPEQFLSAKIADAFHIANQWRKWNPATATVPEDAAADTSSGKKQL